MNCGLCKKPIRGDEKYTTDHYDCGCQLTESFHKDIDAITAERDRLRAALARLVGVDGREELEQMEVVMRATQEAHPAEDIAAAIDAIHGLLATLPVGAAAGADHE